MSKLRLTITMSLDGYVAGPNQSEENPLGAGGMSLHEWFFPLKEFREMHGDGEGGESNASSAVVQQRLENIGATIMGRNMFGPIRGPWTDESWRGWWGENPPFHHPVFVLTHHPRSALAMEGGTTFYFVDDIRTALAQAREAAEGRDVALAGGASCVNQYLAAGLVDVIDLSIAPLILGAGERLFQGLELGAIELEQSRAVEAPGVTHIKYLVRSA